MLHFASYSFRFKSTLRVFAVIILVLALGGCNFFLSRAYNNSPWLINDRIDKYFDISSEQEALIKPQLKQALAIHRAQQLNKIINILNNIKSNIKTLDAKAYDDIFAQAKVILRDHVELFSPAIVSLLTSIDKQQINYLSEKLAQSDKKRRKKLKDVKKRVSNRLEFFADLVGELSTTQKQSMRISYNDVSDFYVLQRAQREFLQQTFIDFLNKKPNASEVINKPIAWLKNPKILQSAYYQAASNAYLEKMKAMHLRLLRSLSDEQMAHFEEILDKYIDLAKSLQEK